jgi:hypothetical protein
VADVGSESQPDYVTNYVTTNVTSDKPGTNYRINVIMSIWKRQPPKPARIAARVVHRYTLRALRSPMSGSSPGYNLRLSARVDG